MLTARAFLPTKCLFSLTNMLVLGRKSSSAWPNNHAPRSALKELTLGLNVATIQSFSRHPNCKKKRHCLERMGWRSENLGIPCTVPARPRLGASSSIHIPGPLNDLSSRSLFNCNQASKDASTNSEGAESKEEYLLHVPRT